MKRGRPKAVVDVALIEKLAGIGCTVSEIAAVAGCSKDTLERNFAAHIEKGREAAKASLRRMQWQTAEKGNATMQIWLGKQMLGQMDKQEHSGPDGGPIEHCIRFISANAKHDS